MLIVVYYKDSLDTALSLLREQRRPKIEMIITGFYNRDVYEKLKGSGIPVRYDSSGSFYIHDGLAGTLYLTDNTHIFSSLSVSPEESYLEFSSPGMFIFFRPLEMEESEIEECSSELDFDMKRNRAELKLSPPSSGEMGNRKFRPDYD